MVYNIEEQRLLAIESLKIKRNEIHIKGTKVANDHNGMMFDEVCDSVKLLIERHGAVEARLITINPAVPLAIQYLKLGKLIDRLNNGEDPRTILYEIVSNV